MTETARLEHIAAGLAASAGLPSPHTVASYTRRWRQWDEFASHHGIPDLPAAPEHIAAFALARIESGVSVAALEANLSAIRWVHAQLVDFAEVTSVARGVVRHFREQGESRPSVGAPVLSVGALLAMAATPDPGTRRFSTKVVRWWLPDVPPRQLAQLRPSDLDFGEDDESVSFLLPAMRAAGRSPSLADREITLRRTAGRPECPVRALRGLTLGLQQREPLFTSRDIQKSTIAGFDPTASPDANSVVLGARNRAVICTGYSGALRVEEIAQLRIENLTPHPKGLHLALQNTKTAEHDSVLLRVRTDALDPVAALNDWIALRGWDDGPLFDVVHHRRTDSADLYAGITAEAVRTIVAKNASLVGLSKRTSGYSLRRSWATHRYLDDPASFAAISRHLRHADLVVTERYIADLRTLERSADDILDPANIEVFGERPPARKNLGFTNRPLDELQAEAVSLASTAKRLAPATIRRDAIAWRAWTSFAAEHDVPALPATTRISLRSSLSV